MMKGLTLFVYFLIGSMSVSALPDSVQNLSKKWRTWHHTPGYAIPPKPRGGPGLEDAQLSDVPSVYILPSEGDGDETTYAMSYIIFDGSGYHSALATSKDLLSWDLSHGVTFDRSPVEGAFDYGGVVMGGYLLQDYDVKSPRKLKKIDDRYWQLYGAYATRGSYEAGPGANGVAWSTNGVEWHRWNNETAAVGPRDSQLQPWEAGLIYQPFPVSHDGVVYDFYNAADAALSEQSGIAWVPESLFPGLAEYSPDGESDNSNAPSLWSRIPSNPILPNGPDGSADSFQAADPKVFWDDDAKVWVMFYFGGNRASAVIMVAFSDDLVTWTKDPVPIYAPGGNPWGLDSMYAHKVSIVYKEDEDNFYMFYCGVDRSGNRGILLLTTKPVKKAAASGVSFRQS